MPSSDSFGIWYGSWGYIAALSFLAIIASVAVAFRFWSRRISGLAIQLDDWLALVTLLVHHGFTTTVFVAFLTNGLGFDTLDLSAPDPGLEKVQYSCYITLINILSERLTS
jgi:hypothetical protein